MAQNRKTPIRKHTQLLAELPAGKPVITGFSVDVDLTLQNIGSLTSSYRSDFFDVIIIHEGELVISINLEEFSAKPGNLVVIAPDAVKKRISAENTRISTVNFTLDFLAGIGMLKAKSDLLNYFSLQYLPHWKLESQDMLLIRKIIQELHDKSKSYHQHPYGKQLLHHTFYIFLYELAALSKKYAQSVSAQKTRKENLVIRFMQIVGEQFMKQRNLESYARALNVTAKHLTQTVKGITGKTAGEIIDDFVLLEAKLLLHNPELNIAEIANELHFSDQSFFGKFFKRHTGLSPKQYRQSL